jgi:hypothetical protein
VLTRVASIVLLPGLIVVLTTAARGESLYEIGNSLTWNSRPEATSATAAAWGRPLAVGHHIQTSSTLLEIWDGVPTFVGEEFGPFNEALVENGWDHVMLQIHKSNGNLISHDVEAFENFVNLTRSNPVNANTKFYMYGSWPFHAEFDKWDNLVLNLPTTQSINAEMYYHHIAERASDAIGQRVTLVPVGEVLERLDDEAKAGRVPGIASVVGVYHDHTHMNAMGSYLASMTVLATVLREDPRGKPVPAEYWSHPSLTPERVAKFQEIVWDVVVNNPYTGITGPRVGDLNGDGDVDDLDLNILQTDMQNQPVLRADGNGDRRVDELDLQLWEMYLNPTPNEVAANFNGDLAVNHLDYNLWKAAYGTVGNVITDANDNGSVDMGDYTIWRDALGSFEARLTVDYNDDGSINLLDRAVWEEDNGLFWELRADLNNDSILDQKDILVWQQNYHDFSARLVGDYDQNGVVDLNDQTVWQQTNGSLYQLNADGNADGEVNMADYVVWRDHYRPSIGAATGSEVPEPGTIALAFVVACGVAAWTGKRFPCRIRC